jgi:hypothetical protein
MIVIVALGNNVVEGCQNAQKKVGLRLILQADEESRY